MTRRWRWLDLAGLAGLALMSVGWGAQLVRQPDYMDAYYYFNGAVQLARGQGFTEPYLWNYLAPVHSLPAPGYLYWMPLTSLAAAPFVAWALPNLAAAFHAAQWPMILAVAGLTVLTYAVAESTTGQRRHAWAAALLTLFSAFYFPFWATTDSFALFGLTAAGALFVYDQARQMAPAQARGWFALSGVLAGLAHLARADGLLVILMLMGFHSGSAMLSRERAADRPGLTPLLWLGAGYLLVMGPWFARNWLAVGALLAPNGTRSLWLTRYDELFTFYPERLTLARYLASGWANILRDKWEALVTNFQTLVAVQSDILAFPLLCLGGWQLRRRRLFQLAGIYGAALFLAMTLAFTWPGARGGYFHSGAALLPFIYTAALVGLDAAVQAVARHLPHWQPARSQPVFTGLLLAGALVLMLVKFSGAAAAARLPSDTVYAEVGAWLRQANVDPAAAVAVNNPPAFYYQAGRPAIVIPGDDVAALAQAMEAFHARWLALDVNVAPGVAPLYAAPQGDPRFRLRATFRDDAGRPVYLLERQP